MKGRKSKEKQDFKPKYSNRGKINLDNDTRKTNERCFSFSRNR